MALSETEFARKAKDLTLTYGEVIEFAASQPKRRGVNPKLIATLGKPKAVKNMGIPLDTPFYRLAETDFMSRFRKLEGRANRWYNFQNLESAIAPVMEQYNLRNTQRAYGEFERPAYPVIAGDRGWAAKTGLGGTQRDLVGGTRAMRGLISISELDAIYAESFETDKMTQVQRDALVYHRNTFQRPAQIFSSDKGGIKKSDVSVVGDFVIIAEKNDPDSNKNRNKIKYNKNSEMGELILRNLNSSKTEFLFDVTNKEYSNLFNRTVMPRIAILHEDKLPFIDGLDESKGRVNGPSVIRGAMARIFQDELGAEKDVVEALMGHQKSSILTENYSGFKPDLGLGDIIERYGYGTTETTFTMLGVDSSKARSTEINNLSNEELQELGLATKEERMALAEQRAAGYKLEAVNIDKERLAFLQSPDGQRQIAELEALEQADYEKKLLGIQRKAELNVAEAKAQQDARQSDIANQDREDLLNLNEEGDDGANRRRALYDIISRAGRTAKAIGLPIIGAGGPAGAVVGGSLFTLGTAADVFATDQRVKQLREEGKDTEANLVAADLPVRTANPLGFGVEDVGKSASLTAERELEMGSAMREGGAELARQIGGLFNRDEGQNPEEPVSGQMDKLNLN